MTEVYSISFKTWIKERHRDGIRTILGHTVIRIPYNPRIGVCNMCRYVAGEIHPKNGRIYDTTEMHHETYDETDVLKHTIELCILCHRRITKIISAKNKNKEKIRVGCYLLY